MINNNQNLSLNFTSRGVHVRDGEWVCHKINERLPHFSTTKFKPFFQNKLRKFCGFKTEPKTPLTIHEVLHDANKITDLHKEIKKQNFFKKLVRTFAKPFLQKHTEKDYQIIEKIANKINELGNKRLVCSLSFGPENKIESALKLLKEHELGNCYENALVAELILKMNGVKNARTLYIKNGDKIEHAVCVFNKDGSEFKEIINNKTIMIDPWAQKADYANNMFVYLKNNFGHNLVFDSKNKSNLEVHDFVKLTPTDTEKFKKRYPSFVFNSKDHEFMKG
jgi:hypothetical protein